MKIAYVPEYSSFMRGHISALYKHVSMELYVAEDGVCIVGMESSNEGKGECQEMISLIKVDFKGKKLYGSPPLSEAAKHIFDKMGVEYS